MRYVQKERIKGGCYDLFFDGNNKWIYKSIWAKYVSVKEKINRLYFNKYIYLSVYNMKKYNSILKKKIVKEIIPLVKQQENRGIYIIPRDMKKILLPENERIAKRESFLLDNEFKRKTM